MYYVVPYVQGNLYRSTRVGETIKNANMETDDIKIARGRVKFLEETEDRPYVILRVEQVR